MDTKRKEVEVLTDQFQLIWKEKQYRNIPIPITKYLRRDKRVSSTAQCFWLFLFEQAFYEEDWQISLSKSELAAEFGKCIKSITRLINSLTELGYLAIKNADKNIYQVIFPRDAIQEILASTEYDRKTSDTSKESYRNMADKNVQRQGKEQLSRTKMSICRDKNVPYTFNNIININNNNNVPSNEHEVPDLAGSPGTVVVSKKIVQEENSKRIKQSTELPDEIEQINKQVQKINQRLCNTHDAREIKALLGEVRQLISRRDYLNDRREKYNTEKVANEQTERMQQKLCEPDLMHKQPGGRQLDEVAYHRLCYQLKKLGHEGQSFNKLINEVICEIRFGHLRTKQGSMEALSIGHAISIAIKLIREERWQQPTAMDKFYKMKLGSG